MEHPLIGNLTDLNLDELSTKINDLNKKLAIATRSGNGHLCGQIRMAIESYRSVYMAKVDESYKKNQDGHNFDDKINIQ